MTTGSLPTPQAPGPIAGQPGHFAHHDWLEGSIAVLNERLIKCWHSDTTVPAPSTVWTACKTNVVNLDTGLDATNDAAGGVILGPGAPAGIYRIDWGAGIEGNQTGYRQACIAVNGTQQSHTKVIVSPSGQASTQAVISGSCVLNIPAGAKIEISAMQNSGATLNLMNSTCRMFLEFLGVMPVTEAAAAMDYTDLWDGTTE